jgi:hypothetical protein
MFGLLKLIATLCIGAVLGFHLNGYLMETECNAAVGNWSGSVCIVNEPQQ